METNVENDAKVQHFGRRLKSEDFQKLHSNLVNVHESVTKKQIHHQQLCQEVHTLRQNLFEVCQIQAHLQRNDAHNRKLNPPPTVSSSNTDDFGVKQFMDLLGISIKCSPERQQIEISFHDSKLTKLTFLYLNGRIELTAISPEHPNLGAIQELLQKTGDLTGLISGMWRKLSMEPPVVTV